MLVSLPQNILAQMKARLAANAEDAEALFALGVHQCSEKNYTEGLAHLQRALALQPRNWRYHYTLGAMYESAGKLPLAIEHTQQAAVLNPENADIWAALSALYVEANQPELMKAKAWHFSMMNDAPRNQAYEQAIATQVHGKIVLEIGAGSGLLSLMAARAGAKHVYTCEMVPQVAAKAAEIISLNGYSEQITVFPLSSFDLELSERADVLITETFGQNLVGENVLAIMADAKARLLKPEAAVIPLRASMQAILVESEALLQQARVQEVCGFDLSPFNEFAVKKSIPITAQNYAFTPLSNPLAALTYDFTQHILQEAPIFPHITATQSGLCHGVISWLQLELAEGVFYENSPLDNRTKPSLHWLHSLRIWEKPIAIKTGNLFPLPANLYSSGGTDKN